MRQELALATILKLTCWACGTNRSILERRRTWAHEIGEPKMTGTELSVSRFGSSVTIISVVLRDLSHNDFFELCHRARNLSTASPVFAEAGRKVVRACEASGPPERSPSRRCRTRPMSDGHIIRSSSARRPHNAAPRLSRRKPRTGELPGVSNTHAGVSNTPAFFES